MMGKRAIITFLKFYTFLFILCMIHYRYDMSSLCRTLDNTNKIRESSVARFDRILAKDEAVKKLKHSKLSEKNKKIKDKQDNKPTSTNTKKDSLNELDSYMKSYEHRYAKRKGLRKLECSCEKKLFDVIDKIDKADKSDNKKLKKKLHTKYGFCFVTTCLIPLLGIVIPVLDKFQSNSTVKSILDAINSQKTWVIPSVIFILLTYIILAIIIYIMIKIIKYEKLKGNKGKMSFNEYCGFCKDVFSK